MKTNKFLIVMSTILFIAITNLSFTQPPIGHWQTIGNSTISTPIIDQITATSIFGVTEPGFPLNIYAGNVQRMIILGTNGNVGIGTIAPNQLLTVNGGNINVQPGTNGYMINNLMTLWRGNTGSSFNIFVGAQAGEFSTNVGNTFIGYRSGRNNTGSANTFTGIQCGANSSGSNNTFNGTNCGQNHLSGSGNTFSGYVSGYYNSSTFVGGNDNTFTGSQSGYNNIEGSENAFIGWASGYFNTSGSSNTFIGFQSGLYNMFGSNNTYLGNNSGPGFGLSNLTNAVGIGEGTIVTSSYKMILGNNINVGIGLSNDLTLPLGPQNMLEIDFGLNGTNPSTPGGPGESGLSFRDLHSGNTAIVNPTNKILSVDSTGKVILVNDQIGSTVIANNGIFVTGTGVVQLGGACTNLADITASQFTTNRAIDLNDLNFEYRNGNVGFGTTTCALGNRVEITGLAPFQTGLRFSNVNSSTSSLPFNGKVLTVDSSGDVFLTDDKSALEL